MNQPLIYRYFEIIDDIFTMHSAYDGDFGRQILVTAACKNFINQITAEGSAPADFAFRLGEMQYFLSVYSLFNPINKSNYELPQTQTQEP